MILKSSELSDNDIISSANPLSSIAGRETRLPKTGYAQIGPKLYQNYGFFFFSIVSPRREIKIHNLRALTITYAGSSIPFNASVVTTTVPGFKPNPPQVPSLKKYGSLTLAWYINLMSSCKRMPIDGMPIPCCK